MEENLMMNANLVGDPQSDEEAPQLYNAYQEGYAYESKQYGVAEEEL